MINKLEYFDDLTGNHIINNARAILIAGISFNILEWKKLSKKILEIELSKLIYKDGFLREEALITSYYLQDGFMR